MKLTIFLEGEQRIIKQILYAILECKWLDANGEVDFTLEVDTT